MTQFLAQYFLNLWMYGSQALVLFFAVRALWRYREKLQSQKVLQGATAIADVRRERSA